MGIPTKKHHSKGHPAIDIEQAEKLAALNCTNEEIAAYFEVSERAVELRWQNDMRFREAIIRGRLKGKISVRRAQFRMMEAGNATMAVWLGKQLLGQRDFLAADINSTVNANVSHEHTFNLQALTNEEVLLLMELRRKATLPPPVEMQTIDVSPADTAQSKHVNGKLNGKVHEDGENED